MEEKNITSIPGPDSESRIVHYAYSYQMLPMLFFSKHNDAVWEQMRNPVSRASTLEEAWMRTCRHFDVQDFPHQGLVSDFIVTEKKEYLVIRMPEPVKSPEAFRCIVEKSRTDGRYRYYSAEYAYESVEEDEQVVLGEWLAPMHRRNLGYLPNPDADEMLVAIAALTATSMS